MYPNGLTKIDSQIDAASCIAEINKNEWSLALDRRTQHFGARYDYTSRKLVYDAKPLDGYIKNLADFISTNFNFTPNQCIVNEYTKGQKITPHIDHTKCFGPKIVTLSVGSSMTMRFTRNKEKLDIVLNSGDFLIIEAEARYEWKHELLPVHDPNFYRVSLTYRTIID